MVLENYWEKRKRGLLPWVKHWNNPQNHLRYSNNVKEMAWNDWFYCHPSAYLLIYYGGAGAGIFWSSVALGLGIYFNSFIGQLISGVLCVAFGYDLIKKIINWPNVKNTTFYDMNMREYN